MSNSDLVRASRRNCCPVCDKPDWCSFSADGSVAICMRTESNKQAKNGGYVHWLKDDNWTPPLRRIVHRPEPKPAPDCDEIHNKCVEELSPVSLGWLSNDLGIHIETIELFEVGYHSDRNVYSMPMRRPNGSICGIKYRPHSGRKFCETGSRSGMFFVFETLVSDFLVIVEGCSDAMAIHDLGFTSVIGRDNCVGNVQQILTLVRRIKPQRVVIIPDNDHHGKGQEGAEALRKLLALHNQVEMIELPEGVNDVRDCVQQKENADRLQHRIDEIINCQTIERDSK